MCTKELDPHTQQMLCCCRRMFESAVAVGVFHKSENRLSINPKEDVVFGPGDQVVALSNSGEGASREQNQVNWHSVTLPAVPIYTSCEAWCKYTLAAMTILVPLGLKSCRIHT